MSLLQLYRDLKTDIKANTSANTVVRYNSQLDNLQDEEAISWPAAFLSFSSQWEDRATGCQSGEITIRVRTVIESYLDDDEKGFILANEIQEVLQGYTKDYFEDGGAMRRIEQGLDENHDQLEEDELVYICTIIDDTADTRKNYQTINPPITLEVTKEIDKDNDTINTGDGIF